MIAGGSSWEALRYGVSSDTGHRGLVIQEGIGLFGGGIVDQNLLGGNRLGRLIVACAEEGERFGIGVFEDSAAVAVRRPAPGSRRPGGTASCWSRSTRRRWCCRATASSPRASG